MLPAPRDPDRPYRVAMVCLGNICRSPVAEVVLRDRLEAAGLAERVRVESFGTGDWHVGRPMDTRAAASLTGAGYDGSRHRARQFVADVAGRHDLVLAMDRANHDDLAALGVPRDRLRLFRDADPSPGDGAVPDPYYGGEDGFGHVLAIVERTADALVEELAELVSTGSTNETRRSTSSIDEKSETAGRDR